MKFFACIKESKEEKLMIKEEYSERIGFTDKEQYCTNMIPVPFINDAHEKISAWEDI